MAEDEVDAILETTQYETRGRRTLVYWPEVKYVQS
jgi:hypothetical protein